MPSIETLSLSLSHAKRAALFPPSLPTPRPGASDEEDEGEEEQEFGLGGLAGQADESDMDSDEEALERLLSEQGAGKGPKSGAKKVPFFVCIISFYVLCSFLSLMFPPVCARHKFFEREMIPNNPWKRVEPIFKINM